ncbi:MAG TPA: hypothetical protein VFC18_06390 [Burkholderiales bacterium]|nr:hypothetical protein [Burkholderiales bacterium]
MKWLAAMLALALVVPAWSQEQKPAPKPTAETPAEKKEPTRMAKKLNPKRHEDARHCLDKPTNTEIIKCAEEYL